MKLNPFRPRVKKRPIDADMMFYGAALKKLSVPVSPSWMAEVRANTVFVLLVLMVFYFCWCLWDRFDGSYPVDVKNVSLLTPVVPAGGKIYVHFDLFRHRICEYDSEYTFIDAQNRRTKFVNPHSNANGMPGEDEAVRAFNVPPDMAAGPGRLRIMTSWSCPENLYEAVYPIVRVLPDIRFVVTPAVPPDSAN